MEIFKLFGSIFVDSSAAQESISKTSGKAEGLGSKLKKGITTAAKWGAAVGAAAVAVGTAMVGAAGKVASTADEIDKASRRAGTTAENYQRLKYAMGQSGISAEKFEKSMIKNQQALNKAAEGAAEYADAYDKLGVSIRDSNGNLREADSVYEEALKKLADMEDINQRNAIANQLFGKSYADLAPILDSGSKGIDDLTSRAEKLGIIMGQDVVDAGVKFGDTMDDANQMGGAFFNMIAAELLPMLQAFLDFIIAHAPEIKETIKNVADGVKATIRAFKKFWEEHGELIKSITSAVFDGIRVIVDTAMKLLRDAIDAVCSLIEGDWEGFWEAIIRIVKNIGSLLFQAGKGALNMLWNGMKSIWESISSWVSDKVNWLVDKLTFWKSASDEMNSGDGGNKADGSHAAGLPYVPFDGYMAKLHKGETVLSAGSSKTMVEDIVNGLAPIMSGGSAASSGPITINLVVDKKVLAQTIFDPLRDVSKQRGVALV
ncbi:MAG: hypothetical protein SOW80_11605 [Anaerovoracaceae bacterium]|nr:hypothetical protein [Anaerovoracaceae bacterium]